MKTSRKLYGLIVILVHALIMQAQQTTDNNLAFPDDYLGKYKGILHVTNPKGRSELPMEFHLLKTTSPDTFVYKIVYVMDGVAQNRDYTLISINSENGDFLIDENNGILLDAKFVDSTLYSLFEVEDNLLTSSLRFNKGYLDFEITFSKRSNMRTSDGADEDAPNDTTIVVSYPVTVVQKARLYLLID
jgi:hypothetical protein